LWRLIAPQRRRFLGGLLQHSDGMAQAGRGQGRSRRREGIEDRHGHGRLRQTELGQQGRGPRRGRRGGAGGLFRQAHLERAIAPRRGQHEADDGIGCQGNGTGDGDDATAHGDLPRVTPGGRHDTTAEDAAGGKVAQGGDGLLAREAGNRGAIGAGRDRAAADAVSGHGRGLRNP
jgi:hypothetical protein